MCSGGTIFPLSYGLAGEENGNPPQYSCLEKSMERGAWWASPWGHKESEMTEWLNTGLATACWYSQKGLDTPSWTRDFCNFVQEDISRSQAYEANRVYLWSSTRQYVCICFKSCCLRVWLISLKLDSNWDLSVWNANKSWHTLNN